MAKTNLEVALDVLQNIESERDRLTWSHKTRDINELLTTMGEFVDDKLENTIEAVKEAIDRIAELEDELEEAENRIKELEE